MRTRNGTHGGRSCTQRGHRHWGGNRINTRMQTFWHRDIEIDTHGDAETWKRWRHGDGERHEDAGDMKTRRHGNAVRHGDRDTWRRGRHEDGYMETLRHGDRHT